MSETSCALEQAGAPQLGDDAVGGTLPREAGHLEVHVGPLGRLVRAADAGQVRQLAALGLRVEALEVPLRGELQRRVDVHLDELARAEQRAYGAALVAERRDERRD